MYVFNLLDLRDISLHMCAHPHSSQTLTDLAFNVELVIPGVQILVATNSASFSTALRARELGYNHLADFLSGLKMAKIQ